MHTFTIPVRFTVDVEIEIDADTLQGAVALIEQNAASYLRDHGQPMDVRAEVWFEEFLDEWLDPRYPENDLLDDQSLDSDPYDTDEERF